MTRRYEPRKIEPEEVIRRAEGLSYLTDEDVERIALRERAREKPVNMLARLLKMEQVLGERKPDRIYSL